MKELQKEIGEWSCATFPGSVLLGSGEHLTREVSELFDEIEIQNAAGIQEEAADCAILLLGIAHRSGFDLEAAIEKKMAINRLRTWGAPDVRGVVEHVEEPA